MIWARKKIREAEKSSKKVATGLKKEESPFSSTKKGDFWFFFSPFFSLNVESWTLKVSWVWAGMIVPMSSCDHAGVNRQSQRQNFQFPKLLDFCLTSELVITNLLLAVKVDLRRTTRSPGPFVLSNLFLSSANPGIWCRASRPGSCLQFL